MSDPYLPSRDYLRECFAYNADTGALTWRARPLHHFDRACIGQAWNTKMAGLPALSRPDKDGYGRGELAYGGRRLRVRAHRAIFKMHHGAEPAILDHIDGDRTNNRVENLRATTAYGNQRNRSGNKARPLPKGVNLEQGLFVARCGVEGRKHYLGRFRTPAEAHAAYCAFARERHGEFFNPGAAKLTIFD